MRRCHPTGLALVGTIRRRRLRGVLRKHFQRRPYCIIADPATPPHTPPPESRPPAAAPHPPPPPRCCTALAESCLRLVEREFSLSLGDLDVWLRRAAAEYALPAATVAPPAEGTTATAGVVALLPPGCSLRLEHVCR